jgi:hypothetical protein
MTVSDMREAVSSLYSGSWPDRVANMKSNQVQAIFYKNFNYDGSKKPKKEKLDNQISIWDL